MVEWEDGSITAEPLLFFAADSPETCAAYAKRVGLLDTDGWKRFKRLAKREKKFLRMLNQAKLSSLRRSRVYQYGFQVPRNAKDAIQLDKENGNTRWRDAMRLEIHQLVEYSTFEDFGKHGKAPRGFQRIHAHFVFAVKHDGRHKARLVAGGHLTQPTQESVYSGVVSVRTLRMVIFLAELNGLELMGADIGNAYLEATTKERVFIVAGPEFEELAGHILVIRKALYGLRTSGARWHERFADCLRDLGFAPSKADPDVWMRRHGNIWEYIAVYVDDIAVAAKNPREILDQLKINYKFKLKGDGPLTFHLGCDFFRDPDGTMAYGPSKYIKKMMSAYESMFGTKPKEYTSPLDKGDHPELDESEELDPDGISKYQSLIGSLQWLVTLGRFDVATAVMTMSRFRAAPRKGHLERIKRIYGYVRKHNSGFIRVRTHLPDYSSLPHQQHDWMYSVYGNVKEEVPDDIPEPLGKPVVLTTYVDANLYHDMLTGRAVTGILQFINATPIEWYTKHQATVASATFGSEFVAARVATDMTIDIRTSLCYLGVPISGPTYMFGDNQAVVTNSTIPHSVLHKRHYALSYHRVREAIVADIIRFYHIDGKENPADVLSKHNGFQQFWPLIKPILFARGDPALA